MILCLFRSPVLADDADTAGSIGSRTLADTSNSLTSPDHLNSARLARTNSMDKSKANAGSGTLSPSLLMPQQGLCDRKSPIFIKSAPSSPLILKASPLKSPMAILSSPISSHSGSSSPSRHCSLEGGSIPVISPSKALNNHVFGGGAVIGNRIITVANTLNQHSPPSPQFKVVENDASPTKQLNNFHANNPIHFLYSINSNISVFSANRFNNSNNKMGAARPLSNGCIEIHESDPDCIVIEDSDCDENVPSNKNAISTITANRSKVRL